MKRLAVRAIIAVIALGIVASGFLLASRNREDEPAASTGTSACNVPRGTVVAVRSKRLTSVVVSRGQPGFAQQDDITLVAPGNAPSDVVTAVHIAPGKEVGVGQPIARVGERPVFAIVSATPGYRDLRFGDRGADVAGLQLALAAQGYSIGGDEAGRIGNGTAAAVRGLYESVGAPSPEAIDRAANPPPPVVPGSPAVPAAPVIVLPRGEYITTGALPATVTKLALTTGASLGSIEQPALSLGSGAVTVRTAIPEGIGRTLAVGAAAELLDTNEQPVASGLVSAVADAAKDEGDGTLTRAVVVQSETALPPGEKIVRIVLADSLKPGLVIPLSAVLQAESGAASVKVASSGTTEGPFCRPPGSESVDVKVSVVSDGEALIQPTTAGSIAEGDLVLATA